VAAERTRRRSLVTALIAVLALVGIGALVFGLWHVVVGGLIHGNPRAGAFGIALAAVSAVFLAGLAVGRRAWLRRR
jgi:hypothetical protein